MRQRSNIFDVRRQTGNFFSGGSGGAILSPANKGWMWAHGIQEIGVADIVAVGVASADQSQVSEVIWPLAIQVSRVIISCSTLSLTAGDKTGVAIYTQDGLTKLLGAVFPTGSADVVGAISVTLSPAIFIPSGPYKISWSCDHIDTRVRAKTAGGGNVSAVVNKNTSRFGLGDAGHLFAAGVAPATVGPLVASSNAIIYCLFEAL